MIVSHAFRLLMLLSLSCGLTWGQVSTCVAKTAEARAKCSPQLNADLADFPMAQRLNESGTAMEEPCPVAELNHGRDRGLMEAVLSTALSPRRNSRLSGAFLPGVPFPGRLHLQV